MMNLLASALAGFTLLVGGLFAHPNPANIHIASSTPLHRSFNQKDFRKDPGTLGKVVSVSGTSFVLSAHLGTSSTTATTYTVNGATAKVIAFRSTGLASSTPLSFSSITTGKSVLVIGAVTGDSINASTIMVGVPTQFIENIMRISGNMHASTTRPAAATN